MALGGLYFHAKNIKTGVLFIKWRNQLEQRHRGFLDGGAEDDAQRGSSRRAQIRGG